MTGSIFLHGGTLDKFVGDQVIALFGTPLSMEDHAIRAARCALEMQKIHKRLQAELQAQGRELPPLGIGISTGEVIAGEFGPPIRTDFTAMGRIVNLGARLCGAAQADQIFISQATYDALGERASAEQLDPLNLKGIHEAVAVYQLLSLT
jgi:adenylate cyclase